MSLLDLVYEYCQNHKHLERFNVNDPAFIEAFAFFSGEFGHYINLETIFPLQPDQTVFERDRVFRFLDDAVALNQDGFSFSFNQQAAKISAEAINTDDKDRLLYAQPINLGILDKYHNKTLHDREWLNDADLRRVLKNMDLADKVHVLEPDPSIIGQAIHFEREKVTGTEPYTIPLLLNKGANKVEGGTHWFAASITINPKTHKISYQVKDSYGLCKAEKTVIRALLDQAIRYQEVSENDHIRKEYYAFPDLEAWKIVSDERHIVGEAVQNDGYSCGYRALHSLLNTPTLAGLIAPSPKAKAYAACKKNSRDLVFNLYKELLNDEKAARKIMGLSAKETSQYTSTESSSGSSKPTKPTGTFNATNCASAPTVLAPTPVPVPQQPIVTRNITAELHAVELTIKEQSDYYQQQCNTISQRLATKSQEEATTSLAKEITELHEKSKLIETSIAKRRADIQAKKTKLQDGTLSHGTLSDFNTGKTLVDLEKEIREKIQVNPTVDSFLQPALAEKEKIRIEALQKHVQLSVEIDSLLNEQEKQHKIITLSNEKIASFQQKIQALERQKATTLETLTISKTWRDQCLARYNRALPNLNNRIQALENHRGKNLLIEAQSCSGPHHENIPAWSFIKASIEGSQTARHSRIGRGLNLAIIDIITGKIIREESVDTFLDPSQAQHIVNCMHNHRAATTDDVLVLTIYDEANGAGHLYDHNISNNLIKEVESYGWEQPTLLKSVGYRHSYLMIKAPGQGNSLESHRSCGPDDILSAPLYRPKSINRDGVIDRRVAEIKKDREKYIKDHRTEMDEVNDKIVRDENYVLDYDNQIKRLNAHIKEHQKNKDEAQAQIVTLKNSIKDKKASIKDCKIKEQPLVERDSYTVRKEQLKQVEALQELQYTNALKDIENQIAKLEALPKTPVRIAVKSCDQDKHLDLRCYIRSEIEERLIDEHSEIGFGFNVAFIDPLTGLITHQETFDHSTNEEEAFAAARACLRQETDPPVIKVITVAGGTQRLTNIDLTYLLSNYFFNPNPYLLSDAEAEKYHPTKTPKSLRVYNLNHLWWFALDSLEGNEYGNYTHCTPYKPGKELADAFVVDRGAFIDHQIKQLKAKKKTLQHEWEETKNNIAEALEHCELLKPVVTKVEKPLLPVVEPIPTNADIQDLEANLAKEEAELVLVQKASVEATALLDKMQTNQTKDINFLEQQLASVVQEKKLAEDAADYFKDAVLLKENLTLAGYVGQKQAIDGLDLARQLIATMLQKQAHNTWIKASFEAELKNDTHDYDNTIDTILQLSKFTAADDFNEASLSTILKVLQAEYPNIPTAVVITMADGRIVKSQEAQNDVDALQLIQHKHSILALVPIEAAYPLENNSNACAREYLAALSRAELLKGLWRDLIKLHTGSSIEEIEPTDLLQYIQDTIDKIKGLDTFSEIKEALNLNNNDNFNIKLTASLLTKLGSRVDDDNAFKISLLNTLFVLKNDELDRRNQLRAHQFEQADPLLNLQKLRLKAKNTLQQLHREQEQNEILLNQSKETKTQLQAERDALELHFKQQVSQVELNIKIIEQRQQDLLASINEMNKRHQTIRDDLHKDLLQESTHREQLVREEDILKAKLESSREELATSYAEVKTLKIQLDQLQSSLDKNENEYTANEAARAKAADELKITTNMCQFINTIDEQVKDNRDIFTNYAVIGNIRSMLRNLRENPYTFKNVYNALKAIPEISPILPEIECLTAYDMYCSDILRVVEQVVEAPTETYQTEKRKLTFTGFNIHWEDCKKAIKATIDRELEAIGLEITPAGLLHCKRADLLPPLNQLPSSCNELQQRIHQFIQTDYERDSRLRDGWAEKSMSHEAAAGVIDKLHIDYDDIQQCFYHSIELVAGNSIVLQEPITLRGMNFNAQALRRIVLPENLKIDTSGKNARDYLFPARNAAWYEQQDGLQPNNRPGDNGEDAFPGQSAGNIYLKAEEIENKNLLILEANGGKGTKGQHGGRGGKGNTGKPTPNAVAPKILRRASGAMTIARHPGVGKGGAEKTDELAGPGGPGGFGGFGSSGGCAGLKTVIDAHGTLGPVAGTVHPEAPIQGNRGANGDRGEAGVAGLDVLTNRRGVFRGLEVTFGKFLKEFNDSMLKENDDTWFHVFGAFFTLFIAPMILDLKEAHKQEELEGDEFFKRVIVHDRWIDPQEMLTPGQYLEQNIRSNDPRSISQKKVEILENNRSPRVAVPVEDETNDPAYRQQLHRLSLEGSVRKAWVAINDYLNREITELGTREERFAARVAENERMRKAIQEEMARVQAKLADAETRYQQKNEAKNQFEAQQTASTAAIVNSDKRYLEVLTHLDGLCTEEFELAQKASLADQDLQTQQGLQQGLAKVHTTHLAVLDTREALNEKTLQEAESSQKRLREEVQQSTDELSKIEDQISQHEKEKAIARQDQLSAAQILNEQSNTMQTTAMTFLKTHPPLKKEHPVRRDLADKPFIPEDQGIKFDEAKVAIKMEEVPHDKNALVRYIDNNIHVLQNTVAFTDVELTEVWARIETIIDRALLLNGEEQVSLLDSIKTLVRITETKCQDLHCQNNREIRQELARIVEGDGDNLLIIRQQVANKKSFYSALPQLKASTSEELVFRLHHYPAYAIVNAPIDFLAIGNTLQLKLHPDDAPCIQLTRIGMELTNSAMKLQDDGDEEEKDPVLELAKLAALLDHLKTTILPTNASFLGLYDTVKQQYQSAYLLKKNVMRLLATTHPTAISDDIVTHFEDEAPAVLSQFISTTRLSASGLILLEQEIIKDLDKNKPAVERLFTAIATQIQLANLRTVEELTQFAEMHNRVFPANPVNTDELIVFAFSERVKIANQKCKSLLGESGDEKTRQALKHITFTGELLETLLLIQSPENNRLALETFEEHSALFTKPVPDIEAGSLAIIQFEALQLTALKKALLAKFRLPEVIDQHFYAHILHAVKQLNNNTELENNLNLIQRCYDFDNAVDKSVFSHDSLKAIEEEMLEKYTSADELNAQSWLNFSVSFNQQLKLSCCRLIQDRREQLAQEFIQTHTDSDKLDGELLNRFYAFYHVADEDETENRKRLIRLLLKKLDKTEQENYKNSPIDASSKNPEQTLIDKVNEKARQKLSFTVPANEPDEELKLTLQALHESLAQNDTSCIHARWEGALDKALFACYQRLEDSGDMPQWLPQFIAESEQLFRHVYFHSPILQAAISKQLQTIMQIASEFHKRETALNFDGLIESMSQACYQANNYHRVRTLAAYQEKNHSKRAQIDVLDEIDESIDSEFAPTIELIQDLEDPRVKYTDMTAAILAEMTADKFNTNLTGRIPAITEIIDGATENALLLEPVTTLFEQFLQHSVKGSDISRASATAKTLLLNLLHLPLTKDDVEGLFNLLRDEQYKREKLDTATWPLLDEITDHLLLFCEEKIRSMLPSKDEQFCVRLLSTIHAAQASLPKAEQLVLLFRLYEDQFLGFSLEKIVKDLSLNNEALYDFTNCYEALLSASLVENNPSKELQALTCYLPLTEVSQESIAQQLVKIAASDAPENFISTAIVLLHTYCININATKNQESILQRVVANLASFVADTSPEKIVKNIVKLGRVLSGAEKENGRVIQRLLKFWPEQTISLLTEEEVHYAAMINDEKTLQDILVNHASHLWCDALKTACFMDCFNDLFSGLLDESKLECMQKQFETAHFQEAFARFKLALSRFIDSDDYGQIVSIYNDISATLSLLTDTEITDFQKQLDDVFEAKKLILTSHQVAKNEHLTTDWCSCMSNLTAVHHEKQLTPLALTFLFNSMLAEPCMDDIKALLANHDPAATDENVLIHQVLLTWITSAINDRTYKSETVNDDDLIELLHSEKLKSKEGFVFIRTIGDILLSMPHVEPKEISTGTLRSLINMAINNDAYKDKAFLARLSDKPLNLWPVYLKRKTLANQLSLNDRNKDHVKIIDAASRLIKTVGEINANKLLRFLQDNKPIQDVHLRALLDGFANQRWELNDEALALLKGTSDQNEWANALTKQAEEADAALSDSDRVRALVKNMRENTSEHMNQCLNDLFRQENGSELTFIEQLIFDIQAKYKTDYEQQINEAINDPSNAQAINDCINQRIAALRRGEDFCKDAHTNRDELVNYLSLLMAAIKLENKKYTLRATQLIALICFIQRGSNHLPGEFQGGRLAEIATGEGKTDTTLSLAITLALRNKKVDVVTSSEYLAERDANLGVALAKRFNLTISNNCDKACHDNESEREHRYKTTTIMYGTTGAFQRDLLLTNFYGKAIRTDSAASLIADEVDSLFIDQLATTLFLSHTISDLSQLRGIFVHIWALVNEGELQHKTAAHMKTIEENIKQLFKEHFAGNPVTTNIDAFIQQQLPIWIENAYRAKDEMHEGVEYSIEQKGQYQGKPLIVDLPTGVEQLNSKWGNGLHQFIELKHTCELTDESLRAIFMSNMTFYRKYGSDIYGMTGTVGTKRERHLLNQIYDKLEFFKVPRYFRRPFVMEEGVLVATVPEWLKAIRKDVKAKVVKKSANGLEPNRAVLVLADNKRSARAIFDDLKENQAKYPNSKIFLFDGNLEEFQHMELELGTVIVATNIAGRGADFKTNEELEEKLGLHVIETYIPENRRVQKQGLGRTARGNKTKCNNGSAKFIVCHPLADSEGIELTLDMLFAERDQREQENLTHIERHLLKIMELEEKLFNKFATFVETIKTRFGNQDNNTTPFELQITALINHWAYWLALQEKNIQAVNEQGDKAVIEAYEKFENNTLAALTKGKGLIAEPCELMALGKWYRDHDNFTDAKSCYEDVIKLSPDLRGFANYYLAFCIINPSSGWEEKKKAVALLKEAKHQLENLRQRLGEYNASVLHVGDISKAQGIVLAPERFTRRIKGDVSLINVHLNAIDAAIGADLKEDSFHTDLIPKEGTDVLYRNIIEHLINVKIDGHALIKGNRVSKKISIDEANELHRKGIKATIPFPSTYDYCKQQVLAIIKAKTGDKSQELRQVKPADFAPFILTEDLFFKQIENHLLVKTRLFEINLQSINLLGQDFWKKECFKSYSDKIRNILINPENGKLSEIQFKKIIEAEFGKDAIDSDEVIKELIARQVFKLNDGKIPDGFELSEQCLEKLAPYLSSGETKKNLPNLIQALEIQGIDSSCADRVNSILANLAQAKCFSREDIKKSCPDDANQLWEQLVQLRIVKNTRIGFSLTDALGADRSRNPDKYLKKIEQELKNNMDLLVKNTPMHGHALHFNPRITWPHKAPGKDGDWVEGNAHCFRREYILSDDKLYYMPDKQNERGDYYLVPVPLTDNSKLLAFKAACKDKPFAELTPEQVQTFITDQSGHIPEPDTERYKKCAYDAIQTVIGNIKRYRVLELDTKHIRNSFAEGKVPPEIEEFVAMCCEDLLAIKEWKSYWDWGALAVFILGVIQFAFGAMLHSIGLVLLGEFFMGEGLGDMVFSIHAAVTKSFSWEGYFMHKATSLAISIATMGIGAFFAEPGKLTAKAGKELTALLKTPAFWKALPSVMAKELGERGAPILVGQVVGGISKAIMGAVFNSFRDDFKRHLMDNKNYQHVKKEIEQIFDAMIVKFGKDNASAKIARALADTNLSQKIQGSLANQFLKFAGVFTSGMLKHEKISGMFNALATPGTNPRSGFLYVASIAANVMNWGGSAALDLLHLAASSIQLFDAFKEQLTIKLQDTATPTKEDVTPEIKAEFVTSEYSKIFDEFVSQIENAASDTLGSNVSSQINQHVTPHLTKLFKPLAKDMRKLKTVAKTEAVFNDTRSRDELPILADKLIRIGSDRALNNADFDADTEVIGAKGPIKIAEVPDLYGSDVHYFMHGNKLHVLTPPLAKHMISDFGENRKANKYHLGCMATVNDETMIIVGEDLNPHPDCPTPITPFGKDAGKQVRYYQLNDNHLVPCELNDEGKPTAPIQLAPINENLCAAQAAYFSQLRDQGMFIGEAQKLAENPDNIRKYLDTVRTATLNNPAAYRAYAGGYAETSPKFQAGRINPEKPVEYTLPYHFGTLVDKLARFKNKTKIRLCNETTEALNNMGEQLQATIASVEEALKAPPVVIKKVAANVGPRKPQLEANPNTEGTPPEFSLTPTLDKLHQLHQEQLATGTSFEDPQALSDARAETLYTPITRFGEMPREIVRGSCYRGDSRAPGNIFDNGFKAKGTSLDILPHIWTLDENLKGTSAYISVAKDIQSAYGFPYDQKNLETSYIYEIARPDHSVDVQSVLEQAVVKNEMDLFSARALSVETELSVPFEIKPNEIKGAWTIDRTKGLGRVIYGNMLTGNDPRIEQIAVDRIGRETYDLLKEKSAYIPNPNYKAPGSSVLKTVGAVGIGLTGAAAAMDTVKLYSAYQESVLANDYSPIRETGRQVLGGWSGALVGGPIGALYGAAGGSVLGPLGSAVGSIAGGVAGSFTGYVAGERLATASLDSKAIPKVTNDETIPIFSLGSSKIDELREYREKILQTGQSLNTLPQDAVVKSANRGTWDSVADMEWMDMQARASKGYDETMKAIVSGAGEAVANLPKLPVQIIEQTLHHVAHPIESGLAPIRFIQNVGYVYAGQLGIIGQEDPRVQKAESTLAAPFLGLMQMPYLEKVKLASEVVTGTALAGAAMGGVAKVANLTKPYLLSQFIETATPEVVSELSVGTSMRNRYGLFTQAEGALPRTLENPAAREWYQRREMENHLSIRTEDFLLDTPLALRAKKALDMRNNSRATARELMFDRISAAKLDFENPHQSLTDLVRKAKTEHGYSGEDIWHSIIESSTRSRGSVNEAMGVRPFRFWINENKSAALDNAVEKLDGVMNRR